MSSEKVYVDQELKELIPMFLANREKDIKRLKKLLAADELTEIKKLGHTIKGAGGGYGFDQVTEFGRQIEEAAAAEQRKELKKLIDEFEEYMEAVEVAYK